MIWEKTVLGSSRANVKKRSRSVCWMMILKPFLAVQVPRVFANSAKRIIEEYLLRSVILKVLKRCFRRDMVNYSTFYPIDRSFCNRPTNSITSITNSPSFILTISPATLFTKLSSL